LQIAIQPIFDFITFTLFRLKVSRLPKRDPPLKSSKSDLLQDKEFLAFFAKISSRFQIRFLPSQLNSFEMI